MKAARVATAVLGALAALAAASPASAEDPKLKQMMGENFASVQSILTALLTTNYADVPARVKVIEDHATHLTENVPKSAEGDRDRFVGYAYNLRSHATDLESIVGLLIEHDEKRARDRVGTDQLREAAAAHYGGMVTMCVACHNRFRPLR